MSLVTYVLRWWPAPSPTSVHCGGALSQCGPLTFPLICEGQNIRAASQLVGGNLSRLARPNEFEKKIERDGVCPIDRCGSLMAGRKREEIRRRFDALFSHSLSLSLCLSQKHQNPLHKTTTGEGSQAVRLKGSHPHHFMVGWTLKLIERRFEALDAFEGARRAAAASHQQPAAATSAGRGEPSSSIRTTARWGGTRSRSRQQRRVGAMGAGLVADDDDGALRSSNEGLYRLATTSDAEGLVHGAVGRHLTDPRAMVHPCAPQPRATLTRSLVATQMETRQALEDELAHEIASVQVRQSRATDGDPPTDERSRGAKTSPRENAEANASIPQRPATAGPPGRPPRSTRAATAVDTHPPSPLADGAVRRSPTHASSSPLVVEQPASPSATVAPPPPLRPSSALVSPFSNPQPAGLRQAYFASLSRPGSAAAGGAAHHLLARSHTDSLARHFFDQLPPVIPVPRDRPSTKARRMEKVSLGQASPQAGAPSVAAALAAAPSVPPISRAFFDASFYHLNVRLDHPTARLTDWVFSVVVTDVTNAHRLLRHTFKNVQVNQDLSLIFHPPGNCTLSPVHDLPWVAAPEALYGHTLRLEVFATHPCQLRIMDTMVFFGDEIPTDVGVGPGGNPNRGAS